MKDKECWEVLLKNRDIFTKISEHEEITHTDLMKLLNDDLINNNSKKIHPSDLSKILQELEKHKLITHRRDQNWKFFKINKNKIEECLKEIEQFKQKNMKTNLDLHIKTKLDGTKSSNHFEEI